MRFCCSRDNDLYSLLSRDGNAYSRYDTPEQAFRDAPEGSGVLILADRYPEIRTQLTDVEWELMSAKRLRVYIEFPDRLPEMPIGEVESTKWERIVVASEEFGTGLPALSILSVSDCRYVRVEAENPWLVVARVAGFDKAVYGISESAAPILFRAPVRNLLVATTKLSGFITGRYGPTQAWGVVWKAILDWLESRRVVGELRWTPGVRPIYAPDDVLPETLERNALNRASAWIFQSRLLVTPDRKHIVHNLLRSEIETLPAPPVNAPFGDGCCGILEGYSSAIRHDGSQLQRAPIRADCQAESAMVLAVHADLEGDANSADISSNLLDFLYGRSGLTGGARGNPEHPAYGLISWGAISPAWEIANYGDDNARVLLATMLASACLKSNRWDKPVLLAVLANLQTTGKLGFRGNRIDMPDLERLGRAYYRSAETVNPAPHYEAYMWACYLLAYRDTGYGAFLETAKEGIRRMMEAYPEGWLFNDTSERGQMLLPLAWLLRLEDTAEHRKWLRTVAGDLLAIQNPCGALPERFHSTDDGYYRIPRTNEEYGVTETPLIQENGDPASDQLYTCGFALLGLHEAAFATGDTGIKEAEDRLARYLCRIQVRSEQHPNLDGAWFRAFDFRKWDYWSSSADFGWGAWCVEAGWGQAWIAATLGLRLQGVSMWDRTADDGIAEHLDTALSELTVNDGGPWRTNG